MTRVSIRNQQQHFSSMLSIVVVFMQIELILDVVGRMRACKKAQPQGHGGAPLSHLTLAALAANQKYQCSANYNNNLVLSSEF